MSVGTGMNSTAQTLSWREQKSRSSLFSRKSRRGDPLQMRIDCLIGEGTRLEGDLQFSGGLRIDGEVQGEVAVADVKPGTLIIGNEGCIKGDVRVSHVIIYGSIHGTVYATGLVDLYPTARITGDIHYGTLEIQPGAQIEGQLVKTNGSGAPR